MIRTAPSTAASACCGSTSRSTPPPPTNLATGSSKLGVKTQIVIPVRTSLRETRGPSAPPGKPFAATFVDDTRAPEFARRFVFYATRVGSIIRRGRDTPARSTTSRACTLKPPPSFVIPTPTAAKPSALRRRASTSTIRSSARPSATLRLSWSRRRGPNQNGTRRPDAIRHRSPLYPEQIRDGKKEATHTTVSNSRRLHVDGVLGT